MVTQLRHLIQFLTIMSFMVGALFSQTIESFDDHTSLNSWGNGGSSSVLATSEDVVEGTGSLDWTYEIIAGESWGGSYDIQILPEGDYHIDLSQRDALSLFYKILGVADPSGIADFNVKLFIESTGGTEQWHYTIPALLEDDTGEWQQAIMPFNDFAIPEWEAHHDEVLYLDRITEIQLQIFISDDAPTTSGRVLLDDLAGYQEDTAPPDDDEIVNINGSFEETEPGPVTDFADGIKGWVLAVSNDDAAAQFEIVEDPVQHGNRALKVDVETLGSQQWAIQAIADSIPVTPGATYELSVWAKSVSPGGVINVTVGNYAFQEYNAIRPANITADGWQEFIMEFTITDDERYIRAPLHFNYAANDDREIYIDNLRIVKIAESPHVLKPVIIEAESGEVGEDFEVLEEDGVTFVRIQNDGWDISDPTNPDWSEIWSKPISENHTITYQVTFPAAGEYNLFVRGRVGPDGAEDDSFFYPEGFGEKDVDDPDDWRIANQLDVGGYTNPDDFVTNRGGAGIQVWKWINISEGNFHQDGISYTVNDDDLTVTFVIGGRETYFDIDKFAFGRADLFYTVRNLDNVEPGSTEKETIFIYDGPPLATGHEKYLGNIYSTAQVPSTPPFFQSYWNQVTPENAGKWESVQPFNDPDTETWNWDQLDNAYNLAKDNDWPFRFHVLVWGSQQPGWITDISEEKQLEAVENWFQAVADRYPDIDHLEVVNEPIPDPPPYREALGGAGETGWDWIINAFEMARDIFPETTKLMINDYGILSGGSKLNTYLGIIDLLLERDLIDAIGVQGHYFTVQNTSTQNLTATLNTLAETGLPLIVTELDIAGNPAARDDVSPEESDETQLTAYQNIFPVLWEHPAVEGITLWGWRLGGWRPEREMHLVNANGSERPALMWLREYVQTTTSVEITEEKTPQSFQLFNNYPNPFNPSTQIMYYVPETTEVSLNVYDILGRHIQTLVNDVQAPGQYTITFTADNLSSGIYLYRLEAGSFVEVKRMMYMK